MQTNRYLMGGFVKTAAEIADCGPKTKLSTMATRAGSRNLVDVPDGQVFGEVSSGL